MSEDDTMNLIMSVAKELHEVLDRHPELTALDANVALHSVVSDVCRGHPKLYFVNGVTSLVDSGMDLESVFNFSNPHRLTLEE
jgi:hypothetical protein